MYQKLSVIETPYTPLIETTKYTAKNTRHLFICIKNARLVVRCFKKGHIMN